jgi:ABC-type branched-subunit amino acid transport system permease subunit
MARSVRRDGAIVAGGEAACAVALPSSPMAHLIIVADILVFALFGASLQLLLGSGGMISFGHAAFRTWRLCRGTGNASWRPWRSRSLAPP